MNLKCDCHWRGVIIQCHSCVSPYQLNTWNCGSDVWNVLKLKVGVITSQIKPEMSLTCVCASTPTLGSFVWSDRRAVDYIPVWKWITDTQRLFRMPPSLFDFFLKCKWRLSSEAEFATTPDCVIIVLWNMIFFIYLFSALLAHGCFYFVNMNSIILIKFFFPTNLSVIVNIS